MTPETAPLEQDVVGKEVGVDGAGRQAHRPVAAQAVDLRGQHRKHARVLAHGAGGAALGEADPAFDAKRIGQHQVEVGAGEVQLGQGRAGATDLVQVGIAQPGAGQPVDDGGRAAVQMA